MSVGWAYLTLGSLAVTAAFLTAAALERRRARYMSRLAETERLRGLFAEARTALVHMALGGRVAPASVTFRSLYSVQTEAMRRSGAYPAFSEELWANFVAETRDSPESREFLRQLEEERVAWDDDLVKIAHQTIRAADELMWSFVPAARLLRHIGRRLPSHLRDGVRRLSSWALDRLEPRHPLISNGRAVKRMLA